VVWRNREASLDAESLEPRTRLMSTYVLQEYFIPVAGFLPFARSELVDAALAHGGRYYLPYRLHASREQFALSYPEAVKFAALKRLWDPQGRMRNALWDKYLP
jgi:hypothetical protein